MSKFIRWVYAAVGVIVLLLAGLVYAWSVIGKSIGAAYPEWTKAQLSLTFTIVMIFFCFGCLIAGFLSKKVKSRYYVLLSAFECIFIFGRFYTCFKCADDNDAVYRLWRFMRFGFRICL